MIFEFFTPVCMPKKCFLIVCGIYIQIIGVCCIMYKILKLL